MSDFLDFLELPSAADIPDEHKDKPTNPVAITRSGEDGTYSWSCPSSVEYDLVGYTIQKWIEHNADSSLVISGHMWSEVSYAPGCTENYLRHGTVSFSYKGSLYGYIADWEKDTHRVFSDGQQRDAIDALQTNLQYKNPLRNKLIQVMSGPRESKIDVKVRKSPVVNLDQVVIEAELRDEMRENTVYHLENIDGDNGIILHGPPGTGKSLSCQGIINETLTAGFTCCYVVGRVDFEALEVFIEKYLSPCLIILEDIDTYAQDRKQSPHSYFSDFLQFMSGISEREQKLVVIATTNHIEYIDEAIARRPVRFNRRLLVDLPDRPQMEALLNHYFKDSGSLPDEAVDKCLQAKFTGSHIAEIRRTAEIRSQKTRCTPAQCFNQAFETLNKQFTESERGSFGFSA